MRKPRTIQLDWTMGLGLALAGVIAACLARLCFWIAILWRIDRAPWKALEALEAVFRWN